MLLINESVGGLNGFSAVNPKRPEARALLQKLRALLPAARASSVQVPVAAGTPVNRSEFGPNNPVFETVWAVQRRQRPPRVTSDTPVWIARPRLLTLMADRSGAAQPDHDVLSDNSQSIAFRKPTGPPVGRHLPAPLGAPASDLLAEVWVSPRFAKRQGWHAHIAGWILVNDRPIPASIAREAAGYGFPDFEVTAHEDSGANSSSIRLVLLGVCLAALILAIAALALERLELQRDARVYTAIGARGRLLRLMVGTRTGVLTFVASLSAIVVGYSVWLANHLFSSEEPPIAISVDLLLVAVALPVMLGVVSAVTQARNHRT